MTDTAQVVTAHRLTDGMALFWTGDGWSERFSEARHLADRPSVERALARAADDEARRLIVDRYAFDVAVGDGRPRRQRERIRCAGRPTVACGAPAPGA